MENQTFIPNGGGMPVSETMPTLLQKPLYQLKKLACVAGISGHPQDDATTLHIQFSDRETMDYKSALQCFNVIGLTTKAMQVNPLQRFMMLKLSHSKFLFT